MSDTRNEKKVEVTLDRPMRTNGQMFSGTVKVDAKTAEELNRRNQAWRDYEAAKHRDNGKQVDLGAIRGNG